MQSRLTEPERSKTTLTQDLAAADQSAPVVRLHPNAAARYRDKVADLEASLSAPEIKLAAAEALRGLIGSVMAPGLSAAGRAGDDPDAGVQRQSPQRKTPQSRSYGELNYRWLRGQDLNL